MYLSGGQKIGAVFHADRKSLERILHLGLLELLQQGGGNQAGVQAPCR